MLRRILKPVQSTFRSRRWRPRVFLLASTALAVGSLAALGIGYVASRQYTHTASVSFDSIRDLPPNAGACPNGGIVARLVPGRSSDPSYIASAPSVLAPSALQSLGSQIRIVRSVSSASTPVAGVSVEQGGAVAGKRSCDRLLADHPVAARLATAGAQALAHNGFPVLPAGPNGAMAGAASPTPTAAGVPKVRGEQVMLLKSPAFRPELNYIMFCVPDEASKHPNSFGGFDYERNVCALAVVASDGTVKYTGLVE